MITSAANRARPKDVPISDLAGAGLRVPSTVRPATRATIDARAAGRIGTPPPIERLGSAARFDALWAGGHP